MMAVNTDTTAAFFAELLNGFSCNKKCRSECHSALVISAMTKSTFRQAQSYCCTICRNFWRIVDSNGRDFVQSCAVTGQCCLLQWLFKHFKPDVSLKYGASTRMLDHECLSAFDIIQRDRLHDSCSFDLNGPSELYSYGENMCCNLGHSLNVPFTSPEPVDFFRRGAFVIKEVSMSKFHTLFLTADGNVFACGHGLGGRTGVSVDEAPVVQPRRVELPEACIAVAAGTDHSLFVTKSGLALSCGLNKFRQLGQLSSEKSSNKVVLSLLPDKALSPRPVVFAKSQKPLHFIGCAAGLTHSVLWTLQSVFTFGLNAGQLGHLRDDEEFIVLPKQVLQATYPSLKIEFLASSDGAVVFSTCIGEIFLMRDYEVKKIATKQLNLKSLKVVGGSLQSADTLHCGDGIAPLRILMLTKCGKVLHWLESEAVFRRCFFNGLGRMLYPADVALAQSSLFAITQYGNLYRGQFAKERRTSQCFSQASHEAHTLQCPAPAASASSPSEKAPGKSSKLKHLPSITDTPTKGRSSGSILLPPTADFAFTDQGRFLVRSECEQVGLTRIPNVHRGLRVFCSPSGSNVAVVQQHPAADLVELPSVSLSTMSEDFANFFLQSDESDALHDLVVRCIPGDKWPNQVEKRFHCHAYILMSRSTYFEKQLSSSSQHSEISPSNPNGCSNGWEKEIVVDGVHTEIMKQLLLYIYSDNSALLAVGSKYPHLPGTLAFPVPLQQQRTNDSALPAKRKTSGKAKAFGIAEDMLFVDPTTLLCEAAKRFGVKSLEQKLQCVAWDPVTELIHLRTHHSLPRPDLQFSQKFKPETRDVVIRTADKERTTIVAHRCVLAARLQYFSLAFSGAWLESSRSRSLDILAPYQVIQDLIFYLYTDKLPCELLESDQLDRLCQLLIHSDQFLAHRLREFCEASLANLISLKNVAELLDFAITCNAIQLKESCLQFISLNLAALLESDSLARLSLERLECISGNYKDLFPHVAHRRIKAYSTDPSTSTLRKIESEFQFDVFNQLSQEDLARLYVPDLSADSAHASKQASNRKRRSDRKDSQSESTHQNEPNLQQSPTPAASCAQTDESVKYAILSNIAEVALDLKEVLKSSQETKSCQNYFERRRTELGNEATAALHFSPKAWCVGVKSSPEHRLISLHDVMEQEEKIVAAKVTPKKKQPGLVEPRIHKGWSIPTVAASEKRALAAAPLTAVVDFRAIQQEECDKQSTRIRPQKSLLLIQTEERAIQELFDTYAHIAETFEEYITVGRVTRKITDPVWKAFV